MTTRPTRVCWYSTFGCVATVCAAVALLASACLSANHLRGCSAALEWLLAMVTALWLLAMAIVLTARGDLAASGEGRGGQQPCGSVGGRGQGLASGAAVQPESCPGWGCTTP